MLPYWTRSSPSRRGHHWLRSRPRVRGLQSRAGKTLALRKPREPPGEFEPGWNGKLVPRPTRTGPRKNSESGGIAPRKRYVAKRAKGALTSVWRTHKISSKE